MEERPAEEPFIYTAPYAPHTPDLYVYGIGEFSELRQQAAAEIFEFYLGYVYRRWKMCHIPVNRKEEQETFFARFQTIEVPVGNKSGRGYLVVDTRL